MYVHTCKHVGKVCAHMSVCMHACIHECVHMRTNVCMSEGACMCVCLIFSASTTFYVNLCNKTSDSSSILLAYRKADLEGTVAQEAGVKCHTVLHGKKDLGWQMENGREMIRKQRKRRNQSPQAVGAWNSPLMMTKINLAG